MQSVLDWYETIRLIKSKEKEASDMEQSFNLLKEWIMQKNFKKVFYKLIILKI
ncbi:MAG: hypothetical protein K0R16_126 [Nitrososphaeraceae archaeon]|jgi:hypothetical protein|nr:hypothetical protein [Nitrososphaeraceae archaeon]